MILLLLQPLSRDFRLGFGGCQANQQVRRTRWVPYEVVGHQENSKVLWTFASSPAFGGAVGEVTSWQMEPSSKVLMVGISYILSKEISQAVNILSVENKTLLNFALLICGLWHAVWQASDIGRSVLALQLDCEGVSCRLKNGNAVEMHWLFDNEWVAVPQIDSRLILRMLSVTLHLLKAHGEHFWGAHMPHRSIVGFLPGWSRHSFLPRSTTSYLEATWRRRQP